MFVQNLTKQKLTYEKGKTKLEIAPLKLRYIDEVFIPLKEIKEAFKDKVKIYSLEKEEKKAEAKKEAGKAVEIPVKEEKKAANTEVDKALQEALEDITAEQEVKTTKKKTRKRK